MSAQAGSVGRQDRAAGHPPFLGLLSGMSGAAPGPAVHRFVLPWAGCRMSRVPGAGRQQMEGAEQSRAVAGGSGARFGGLAQAARSSPVAIRLSCLPGSQALLTLLQDSPLPSPLSLQQHWLARLPSQIRLIVHFNKVLPLCESAVISSRWKRVLHNPDTSGMQECTARLFTDARPWCMCVTPAL